MCLLVRLEWADDMNTQVSRAKFNDDNLLLEARFDSYADFGEVKSLSRK